MSESDNVRKTARAEVRRVAKVQRKQDLSVELLCSMLQNPNIHPDPQVDSGTSANRKIVQRLINFARECADVMVDAFEEEAAIARKTYDH